MTDHSEECCPRFNPEPWDDKELVWEDKKFVKDRVRSLFHMPLNFSAVMRKNVELIEKANAKPTEMIVLSDENSPWGADVYLEATQDVPNAQMVTLSGTVLSKVFEGPYKNIGTWVKEMDAHVKAQGKTVKKLYFYYTTCPKCAKKYGKNYVVLLAKV